MFLIAIMSARGFNVSKWFLRWSCLRRGTTFHQHREPRTSTISPTVISSIITRIFAIPDNEAAYHQDSPANSDGYF